MNASFWNQLCNIIGMTTWTHDRILTHFKGRCLVGSWLKSTIFTNRCSFLKPVSFEPITRAINGMWSTDSIYIKVLRLILTAPLESDQQLRLSDFVESTVAVCYHYRHLLLLVGACFRELNMFNWGLLRHGMSEKWLYSGGIIRCWSAYVGAHW